MLSALQMDPTQFFRDPKPPVPFALLVLNQPINERAFAVLRKHGEPLGLIISYTSYHVM